MLLHNEIESLIPLSVREFNGETFYYFDVSGRTSFYDMFAGEKDILERDDVERLCQSFMRLSEAISEHLLDPDEVRLSPELLFYDTESQSYEFLYVPAGEEERKESETAETFNHKVKTVWDRVMEKFNHQSDLETLARVYDIYQKVSMQSFDLKEVFAPVKYKDRFSKEFLKETMKEGASVRESVSEEPVGEVSKEENVFAIKSEPESGTEKAKEKTGLFERLNMRLAGSAGFISGKSEAQIRAVSEKMDEEEKLSSKIKAFVIKNSKSLFRAAAVLAVMFLGLCLLPDKVSFKPPLGAAFALFLICAISSVFFGKIYKERKEAVAEV